MPGEDVRGGPEGLCARDTGGAGRLNRLLPRHPARTFSIRYSVIIYSKAKIYRLRKCVLWRAKWWRACLNMSAIFKTQQPNMVVT